MIVSALRFLACLAEALLWTLVAAWLLLLYATPAHAMQFDARDGVIRASGTIAEGDAARLAQLPGATLILNSNGGLVSEAVQLADIIRARRLSVAVANRCDSACFLLLVAGSDRFATRDATVGVHSAHYGDNGANEDAPDTLLMARKALAMGATSASVAKMIGTPSATVTYLNADDLAGLGVRVLP